MYRLRKKFTFESAHILDTSYSKDCQNVHGHSYILEVFLSTKQLSLDGMVCDFKTLKEIVQEHVLQFYDHAFIFSSKAMPMNVLPIQGLKTLMVTKNPTAENMAQDIYERLVDCFEPGVKLEKIRLHETATGWAEYYA